MDEGNYSNCKLLEAVFADGKFGPQWALTFDVSGNKRTVYMGVGTETNTKGETWQAVTTKTLISLGWNQDMDEPRFKPECYDPGIDLYMKISGTGKERWYISSGDFKAKPAAADLKQNFKATFRALAGSQPRPANAKPPAPSTPPARKGPPPSTVPAKDQPLDTSGVTDLQTAWDFATTNNPGLSETRWVESIADIAKKTKRKEEAFTVEDWRALALDCSLPF